MKKTALTLMVVLLIAICSIRCMADNAVKLNRVVVTFSPLVVNNINCTDQLFDVFSKLVKTKSSLSEDLEASGALWSISQNLCGLQICISSSKSPKELCEIVGLFLSHALKDTEKILTSTKSDIKPVDRLYQFLIDSDDSSFKTKPVSLSFYDYSGKEIEGCYSKYLSGEETAVTELASDTETNAVSSETEKKKPNDFINDYINLYERSYNTNMAMPPKVQQVSKPILAKLIFWNKLTPDTFISASLIKNKLIFDGENSPNSAIELFNSGKGLVLVVLSEVDKNSLYAQHLLMSKRIDAAVSGIGPKEWEAWNGKLLEVMRNDRRDYNKKAMFDEWNKHWGGIGFNSIPNKSDFKKPDCIKEAEIFSTQSEHNFYLTPNTYPAIYACNDENFTDGSNVAVCLQGHTSFIDGIENHVRSLLKITVPITINRKRPDRITLSFYSPEAKIPAHLSRIKSSISDYLYSKFNVTDLKKSIRIGIAGISSIPAYQLHGLLSLGWPTNKSRYESRLVTQSDLYDFVKNSSANEQILKNRWENLASSPQDKAYILSVLACNNLIIDSWFGRESDTPKGN